MRLSRAAFSIVAAAIVLAELPLAGQPSGYVARVTSVVVWVLEEEEFRQLTPDKQAELRQKGMTVVAGQRSLQSPELGLAGHWLEFKNFGKRRYSTDMDGYVRVPTRPPVTTNVKVFAQVGDKKPIGVLDRITFVPEGQTPPASVLKLTYKPPAKMTPEQPAPPPPPDADEDGAPLRRVAWLGNACAVSLPVRNASFQPPHCDRRRPCPDIGSPNANAAPGCCLDYNGTLGDGEPYLRSGNCGAQGYLNFIESTCWQWTFLKRGRPCFTERAILQVEGPTCWNNHKYRSCQNMNEADFSLNPPTATVEFGQSVQMALRNNTPGNSTCLQVTGGPGKPKLTLGSKGGFVKAAECGGYRADHFTNSPRKHYEDMVLRFKAPSAPKNACRALYTLSAQSGGQATDASITAIKPGGCACGGFGEVRRWNVTVSFEYSGSAEASTRTPGGDTESQSVQALHTGSVTSVLSVASPIPASQWSGTGAAGQIRIADPYEMLHWNGNVSTGSLTYSGRAENAYFFLRIDPHTCTYGFSASINVMAQEESGGTSFRTFVDVLSTEATGRPLPADGSLTLTGALDLRQEGNGIVPHRTIEAMASNGYGSHQGRVTWKITRASP